LDKDLGTRHRAGIGVTENTDSLSVIVSEETGNISFAKSGQLARPVSPEKLRKLLKEALSDDEGKKNKRTPSFFRKERKHER
jgi:diadenylate cyclase